MKFKLITLLGLTLLVLTSYVSSQVKYYFVSQEELRDNRIQAKKEQAPYTTLCIVTTTDTIEVTQCAITKKPHREYRDIYYLGSGIEDRVEWLNCRYDGIPAVFIYLKSFNKGR